MKMQLLNRLAVHAVGDGPLDREVSDSIPKSVKSEVSVSNG